MVQVKKWLSHTAEAMLSPWIYSVTVTDTQMLSNELKLVHFTGDFHNTGFKAGQDVLIKTTEGQLRHYTMASFSEQLGTCSIVFHLHGNGPGSRWATQLQIGDTIKFAAVKRRNGYDEDVTHHFFFGDETSVGCFEWFKNIALQNDHEYFGILEMKEENEQALTRLKMLIETVEPMQQAPAANAIQWMKNMHPNCWNNWKKATFYLVGRAASIQAMQKYLRDCGIPSSKIRCSAYWADGKTGL